MAEDKIQDFQLELGRPGESLRVDATIPYSDQVDVLSGAYTKEDGITLYTYAGGTSTSFTGVTEPNVVRYDLLCLDIRGSTPLLLGPNEDANLAGVEQAVMTDWWLACPTVPNGYIPLAVIMIDELTTGTVTVSPTDIIDVRGFFKSGYTNPKGSTSQVLTAGFIITPGQYKLIQVSSAGAVTSNAATPIAAGSYAGQEITIVTTSAFDIIIQDAGNTNLRGDWNVSYTGCTLTVVWNGTVWVEKDRNAWPSSNLDGEGAFAVGFSTTIAGDYSVGIGDAPSVSGNYSLGVGTSPSASGVNSLAVGDQPQAVGAQSVAFGATTRASGVDTLAQGIQGWAAGNYSSAFGFSADNYATGTPGVDLHKAEGAASTVIGSNSYAAGANSIAAGSQAVASGSQSFAFGNSLTASGDNSCAVGDDTTASGTGAFASGDTTTASGNNSASFGNSTAASGDESVSLGTGTKAIGDDSVASGTSTVVTANGGHSEGTGTISAPSNSYDSTHAEGRYSLSGMGYGGHAEGFACVAGKRSSGTVTATGVTGSVSIPGDVTAYFNDDDYIVIKDAGAADARWCQVNGAPAFGGVTTTFNIDGMNVSAPAGWAGGAAAYFLSGVTTDYPSHAEGQETEASGNYSHAEGYRTSASGVATHAGGNASEATGVNAFAHGNGAAASGDYSTAIGRLTAAQGDYSLATGRSTTANGDYSTAFGYSSRAHMDSSVALSNSSLVEVGGAQSLHLVRHVQNVADTGSDTIVLTIPDSRMWAIRMDVVAGTGSTAGAAFRHVSTYFEGASTDGVGAVTLSSAIVLVPVAETFTTYNSNVEITMSSSGANNLTFTIANGIGTGDSLNVVINFNITECYAYK